MEVVRLERGRRHIRFYGLGDKRGPISLNVVTALLTGLLVGRAVLNRYPAH
jgi:hypothetical protein